MDRSTNVNFIFLIQRQNELIKKKHNELKSCSWKVFKYNRV